MADEVAARFAAQVARLEKRIRDLEKGTRAPQLGNASLDLDSSRGYIPIRQNGIERGRLGRMPDGTINFTSVNNPEPPPTPFFPDVEPVLAGLKVNVLGIEGEQPHDFSHVRIYCDGLQVGTLSQLPGAFIVAPLSYESHVIWVTAVNLSGMESEPTESAFGTPKKAVADDITDGILEALEIADGAITEAKLAVAAVTNTKIGPLSVDLTKLANGSVDATKLLDDAVTSDKIAVAAVVAEAIAANAIIAGKIAAGTVTAAEIAALTISAGNIAADAIAAGKIAADAVTAREILALSITADKLATNSVTAAAIAAGSITAEKLAAELILASRVIVGDPDDWHLELQAGNAPILWWNNDETGFVLSRDPLDGTSNVYVSGRVRYGTGSEIGSDMIDMYEQVSTGTALAKAKQSRHWIQSADSTSISPKWTSPTTISNTLIMSVYAVSPNSIIPTINTPSGWTAMNTSSGTGHRLSTYILENNAGGRTTETITTTTNVHWAITLWEWSGLVTTGVLDRSQVANGVSATASSGTTSTTSQANEICMAFFGAPNTGYTNGRGGKYNAASNGFVEAFEADGIAGHSTMVATKKTVTTGTQSCSVAVPPTTGWVGSIVTLKIDSAGSSPPNPPANTLRMYGAERGGKTAPHVLESSGTIYPLGRKPIIGVGRVGNYSLTANTDVYAQTGWNPSYDPEGLVQIGVGVGSYSNITIPLTGWYDLDYLTIFSNSTNTTDTIVSFITRNSRTTAASVARGAGKFINLGTDGSPVRAKRMYPLNAGDILYWGNWSSVNVTVLGNTNNIYTEIIVSYISPF